MSLRKIYATDAGKETAGVTLQVGMNDYNGKPIEITVSRMSHNNQLYQKAFTEKFDPHQAAIQGDTLDEQLARKLVRELFADEVLKDVKNVPLSDLTEDDADNDKVMDYNRDNVLALFEKYPDVYDDWSGRAKKASNFRKAANNKAAGNSPKS